MTCRFALKFPFNQYYHKDPVEDFVRDPSIVFAGEWINRVDIDYNAFRNEVVGNDVEVCRYVSNETKIMGDFADKNNWDLRSSIANPREELKGLDDQIERYLINNIDQDF